MKNDKPKFTPWVVVEHPESKTDHQFVIREQDATVNIGSAFNIKLTNARSNAYMMSAAPEMYQLLNILACHAPTKEFEEEVDRVLKKARGE